MLSSINPTGLQSTQTNRFQQQLLGPFDQLASSCNSGNGGESPNSSGYNSSGGLTPPHQSDLYNSSDFGFIPGSPDSSGQKTVSSDQDHSTTGLSLHDVALEAELAMLQHAYSSDDSLNAHTSATSSTNEETPNQFFISQQQAAQQQQQQRQQQQAAAQVAAEQSAVQSAAQKQQEQWNIMERLKWGQRQQEETWRLTQEEAWRRALETNPLATANLMNLQSQVKGQNAVKTVLTGSKSGINGKKRSTRVIVGENSHWRSLKVNLRSCTVNKHLKQLLVYYMTIIITNQICENSNNKLLFHNKQFKQLNQLFKKAIQWFQLSQSQSIIHSRHRQTE